MPFGSSFRPSHWDAFTHHLNLLATSSSALRNSTVSPEKLQFFVIDTSRFGREGQSRHCPAVSSGSLTSSGGHRPGYSNCSLWIPIDLYLEDCLDGSVAATDAIEVLSGKRLEYCENKS